MSSSETTGDSPVALTQYFTGDSSLDHGIKVSASPSSSHSDSGEVGVFEASLQFAFATTCCFASPPVGADRICTRPTRAFTSGLPTVWSPAPPPDITTVPTGKHALTGLSPARSSTSFTAPLCQRLPLQPQNAVVAPLVSQIHSHRQPVPIGGKRALFLLLRCLLRRRFCPKPFAQLRYQLCHHFLGIPLHRAAGLRRFRLLSARRLRIAILFQGSIS